MMNDGMIYKQREIILIPFPYSDLSQNKKRPAIILSNSDHNTNNEDVICCAITTNPRDYANSVEITSSDLDSGDLQYDSRVKPNKIFTLGQRLIIKKLGRLNIVKSREIIERLNICIEIEDS